MNIDTPRMGNARSTCKERRWPPFKQVDLRDTGSREVARQPTIISGCFTRKEDHSKSKPSNKEEIEYQGNRYLQRSGLGHIGCCTGCFSVLYATSGHPAAIVSTGRHGHREADRRAMAMSNHAPLARRRLCEQVVGGYDR